MNNNQLISVIIPTFNRGHCIERCIHSVLNQTYKNLECIVIDNFSTDETNLLISKIKDPRLKFFKIKNEGIIAKSRNLGIEYSKGNIIAFLDSDDWWKENKLQICIKEINLGADFVYHNLKIKYDLENNYFLKKPFMFSKKITGDSFRFLIKNGNPIPLSSSILRKKILIDSGGFDQHKNLIGGEDYFLWLKISLTKCKFKRLNLALGYYTINNDAVTSSEKCKTYFKEIFSRLYNLKLIRKNKISSWANFSLSYIYLREEDYLNSFKNLIRSFLNANIKQIFKSLLLLILFLNNILLRKLFYSIFIKKLFFKN